MSDFLTNNQNEITKLVSIFEKNIAILEHQKNQTSLLIAILEECGGLTIRARNKMTTSQDKEKFQKEIAEFENWFRITLKKLDKAVVDSDYNGINLMNGGSIITPLDDKGQRQLTTEGLVLTTTSLGIRDPDFSDTFSTQNSRIDVMNAIDMVVTIRNIISSHISSLKMGVIVATHSLELAKEIQPRIFDTCLLNETSALLRLDTQSRSILGDESMAEPSQQEILKNFASSAPLEDI